VNGREKLRSVCTVVKGKVKKMVENNAVLGRGVDEALRGELFLSISQRFTPWLWELSRDSLT